MKNCVRLLCSVAVFALAIGGSFAGDEVTLEGSFVWSRTDGNRTGDVRAVFTPQGEDEWAVSFHFEWEDGPHVYTGTASGSLSEGALQGEVKADGEQKKASFRFSGTFADGTFSGTHANLAEDGSLRDTGTITLRAGD